MGYSFKIIYDQKQYNYNTDHGAQTFGDLTVSVAGEEVIFKRGGKDHATIKFDDFKAPGDEYVVIGIDFSFSRNAHIFYYEPGSNSKKKSDPNVTASYLNKIHSKYRADLHSYLSQRGWTIQKADNKTPTAKRAEIFIPVSTTPSKLKVSSRSKSIRIRLSFKMNGEGKLVDYKGTYILTKISNDKYELNFDVSRDKKKKIKIPVKITGSNTLEEPKLNSMPFIKLTQPDGTVSYEFKTVDAETPALPPPSKPKAADPIQARLDAIISQSTVANGKREAAKTRALALIKNTPLNNGQIIDIINKAYGRKSTSPPSPNEIDPIKARLNKIMSGVTIKKGLEETAKSRALALIKNTPLTDPQIKNIIKKDYGEEADKPDVSQARLNTIISAVNIKSDSEDAAKTRALALIKNTPLTDEKIVEIIKNAYGQKVEAPPVVVTKPQDYKKTKSFKAAINAIYAVSEAKPITVKYAGKKITTVTIALPAVDHESMLQHFFNAANYEAKKLGGNKLFVIFAPDFAKSKLLPLIRKSHKEISNIRYIFETTIGTQDKYTQLTTNTISFAIVPRSLSNVVEKKSNYLHYAIGKGEQLLKKVKDGTLEELMPLEAPNELSPVLEILIQASDKVTSGEIKQAITLLKRAKSKVNSFKMTTKFHPVYLDQFLNYIDTSSKRFGTLKGLRKKVSDSIKKKRTKLAESTFKFMETSLVNEISKDSGGWGWVKTIKANIDKLKKPEETTDPEPPKLKGGTTVTFGKDSVTFYHGIRISRFEERLKRIITKYEKIYPKGMIHLQVTSHKSNFIEVGKKINSALRNLGNPILRRLIIHSEYADINNRDRVTLLFSRSNADLYHAITFLELQKMKAMKESMKGMPSERSIGKHYKIPLNNSSIKTAIKGQGLELTETIQELKHHKGPIYTFSISHPGNGRKLSKAQGKSIRKVIEELVGTSSFMTANPNFMVRFLAHGAVGDSKKEIIKNLKTLHEEMRWIDLANGFCKKTKCPLSMNFDVNGTWTESQVPVFKDATTYSATKSRRIQVFILPKEAEINSADQLLSYSRMARIKAKAPELK